MPKAILNHTTSESARAAKDFHTAAFLTSLEAAEARPFGGPVNDFAQQLLRISGFQDDELGYQISTGLCTTLNVGRNTLTVLTDVCVVDLHQIMLLTTQDRQRDEQGTHAKAVPQLVGQCVSAFVWNNEIRLAAGLPKQEALLIPGIILKGTTPEFYLLEVTGELVIPIGMNAHPELPVKLLSLSVDYPDGPVAGMCSLRNRRNALIYFEAFKCLVLEQQKKTNGKL